MNAETLDTTCARILANIILDPSYDSKVELARQREQESITQELRGKWNAPKRHTSNGINVNSPKEWMDALAALQGRLGTGFMAALTGLRGNGKTQIGVCLMFKTTENLRPALFTTATGFFIDLKSSYRKDAREDEKAVLARYRKPSLLVIDEVGKRGETDWENAMLFELVNSRYNDMTDTLLIDNRSAEEFRAMIGPSLASRMSETGGIIECTWESFR